MVYRRQIPKPLVQERNSVMNLAKVRIRSAPADTAPADPTSHDLVVGVDPRLLWSFKIDDRFICELQTDDDNIRRLFVFDVLKTPPKKNLFQRVFGSNRNHMLIGYRPVPFGYGHKGLADGEIAYLKCMCEAHIDHIITNKPRSDLIVAMRVPDDE
jgi:hypothetical protein